MPASIYNVNQRVNKTWKHDFKENQKVRTIMTRVFVHRLPTYLLGGGKSGSGASKSKKKSSNLHVNVMKQKYGNFNDAMLLRLLSCCTLGYTPPMIERGVVGFGFVKKLRRDLTAQKVQLGIIYVTSNKDHRRGSKWETMVLGTDATYGGTLVCTCSLRSLSTVLLSTVESRGSECMYDVRCTYPPTISAAGGDLML